MERNYQDGLVYSTSHGRMCPDCSQALDQCRCKDKSSEVWGDGNVRVGRETKGRKGKGVTTVTGLALNTKKLTQLARQLKQRCGAGGTVKDGVIEIQGEHRDVLVAELEKLGYHVKHSGG